MSCDLSGMNAIVTTLSLISFFIGQWLVTRHRASGFLIWAASNLMVAIANLAGGSPSTACMFSVYFIVNAHSLIQWRREISAAGCRPISGAGSQVPSVAR